MTPGEILQQFLTIIVPAIIGASAGILAIVLQTKRENKRADADVMQTSSDSKKTDTESIVLLSDASLRLVERMQARLDVLEVSNHKYVEDMVALQSQISELNSINADKEKQYKELISRIKALEEENEHLRNQVVELTKENVTLKSTSSRQAQRIAELEKNGNPRS